MYSINRIDISLDMFSDCNLFECNPMFDTYEIAKVNDTRYINNFSKGKKRSDKFLFEIYPKNTCYKEDNNDFSYNDITRIELRLFNYFLVSRNLKDLLSSNEKILKYEKIVIELFTKHNFSYNGVECDFKNLKVADTMYDFINFLELDSSFVDYKKYKKFTNEINKQTKILDRLKSEYKLKSILDIFPMIDKKELNINKIHRDTNIDRRTLSKVINHFRSIHKYKVQHAS